ncbi:hypothetical protein BDD12DRAFT_987625 [Trichophaea hybrida]|nr:hypothetical protein BDD12DRAFT_987625 [Trichophaea hybrida]
MNPYEADPTKIPADYLYTDLPFYDRYLPRSDDFTPDPKHINSTTLESIAYWKKCPQCLREESTSRKLCGRDYSFSNLNEVKAIERVKELDLGNVQIPQIYFAGNMCLLLVQSRIPGVGQRRLEISLSRAKGFFQSTSSDILRRVRILCSPLSVPSHVNPNPNLVNYRGIQQLERELLFDRKGFGLGLMHNDLQRSNWKRAAAVHVQIRSPKREDYAHLNLDKKSLDDIFFAMNPSWNDLNETNHDV